jgi:hypothetical protein
MHDLLVASYLKALRVVKRRLVMLWHVTALNLLQAVQQAIACCMQLHCVLLGCVYMRLAHAFVQLLF